MTTLTQSMLDSLANQTFSVTTDYTMNGATLIFNGMTILFNGGTISNVTMQLSNCTLSGVATHSINATVVGTLTNSTIYSSWFTRIGQMKFNYTGKTINFDENATILDEDDTVKIDQVNHVTFNGMFNTFTCHANFFEIYDNCSYIEIKKFVAVAQGAPDYGCLSDVISFVRLGTRIYGEEDEIYALYEQAYPRYSINVLHNSISYFNVGISLGADVGAKVVVSNVYENSISYTKGTEAGFGYGIHLANAYGCKVYDNNLYRTTRHAIYHAWGSGNEITDNTITDHWYGIGLPENSPELVDQPSRALYKTRAAVAVYRKSTSVLVSGNTFINSYNSSICLTPNPEAIAQIQDIRPYGQMNDIRLLNNTFTHTGPHDASDSNINHKHPAIKVGGAMNSAEIQAGYLINTVKIKNNIFSVSNSDFLTFCHIYQCFNLEIIENTITFSSYPFNSDIIHLLVAFNNANVGLLTMDINASGNVFCSANTSTQANVTISAFSDVSAHFNTGSQMSIFNNTLSNQTLGGILMYQLYYGFNATAYGPLPNGFYLQLEN